MFTLYNWKGNNDMENEIVIDENLFFLKHLLINLEPYNFDKDITNLLKYLKEKIDKKLWSELIDDDIEDYKIVFRYKIEKK